MVPKMINALKRLVARLRSRAFGAPETCAYFSRLIAEVEETKRNFLVTGAAGTGKTTFLRCLLKRTRRNTVVLAPTGLAALNVGGQTIHSFFKLRPQDPIDPKSIVFSPLRAHLYRAIEILVIDEISMVRSDLLSAIDKVLRLHRASESPFGGCQVVLVGDYFQLPPVVRQELEPILQNLFGGPFFFDAPVFRESAFRCFDLGKVFRQSDSEFIDLLGRARTASLSDEDLVRLNSRHVSLVGRAPKEAVVLTTKRKASSQINREHLSKLPGDPVTYEAALDGSMRDRHQARLKGADTSNVPDDDEADDFPAPLRLRLKLGARIIMLRNDSRKRWVNGSIGSVRSLSPDSIGVKLASGFHLIERETWDQVAFDSRGSQIESRVQGAFRQFPMRLAWALTIHKAQGQSLDCVSLELAGGAFAAGQSYVALSRCTRFDGLYLSSELRRQDVFLDTRVQHFHERVHHTVYGDAA